MPFTLVVIQRRIPKEKQASILPLLKELRARATVQPGYISGQTLLSMDNPEEYLVISSWKSEDNWKAWLFSERRGEIQDKIDTLLDEETEYGVYFYA